jgi:hypothetical protein
MSCALPRYYFDTFDGRLPSSDSEGIECASRQEIQHAAVDALPDMAREFLPDGPNRLFRVDVRDSGGKVLFRATLELKSSWLDGYDQESAAGSTAPPSAS